MNRPSLAPVVTVIVASSIGCGGKTAGNDTRDACAGCTDGAAADTPTPPTCTGQPRRPTVVVSDGATKWFVMKRLFLGLSVKGTEGAKLSADAWKDYGFDLDCRDTSADDSKNGTNTCRRVAGSATGILSDGNGGIDNSFGAHVMQTIKSLKSDAEDAANQPILAGGSTLLLRLDNVTSGDNAAVPGALYVTGALTSPAPPRFDGSDVYAVDTSSVSGGDLSKPILTFPNGYTSSGYWVSGDFGAGAFTVPLPLAGTTNVPLQAGVVTFRVDDGTDGTIAGAVDTGQFRDAITPWVESYGICPGNATFDQVVITVTQSADLVSDAPQLQDTTVTCNALSLGIGFELAPVQMPTAIAPTPTVPPGPCH